MKNEKITTFRKFNQSISEKNEKKLIENQSKKLLEDMDSFHNEQLKLQELQKKYVGIEKENKSEREELKKAIIIQTGIVEEKEIRFKKALGNEDIKDLEI